MARDVLVLSSTRIPSLRPIVDLAVVARADGPLVVCADSGAAVWTWDPLREVWRERPLAYAYADEPLAAQYPDAGNEIGTVAALVVGGRVVLAAGHDEQASALWDLETGRLLRGTTYDEPYNGAIATVDGEGAPCFVTGSQYVGLLQVWEASGQAPPRELSCEQSDITSLATARIDGRTLIAVGGDGVDVVDLTRNEKRAWLGPDEGLVRAVRLDRLADGRPVVAAATDHGELYVWDLPPDADHELYADTIHEPMTGHEGRIVAMDTATVGGRLVAVTGAEDETVRIWDIDAGTPIGTPLVGHGSKVEAVRTTVLRGRDVAVSAGRDGTVRVWDLDAVPR